MGRANKTKAIVELLSTGTFTIEEIAEKCKMSIVTVTQRVRYTLPNSGILVGREADKYTLINKSNTEDATLIKDDTTSTE